MAGLTPACVVVVATVRALKYNGGVPKAELSAENVPALEKGVVNLKAHVENMQKFGIPVVVAINRFGTDSDAELQVIDDCCKELGVRYAPQRGLRQGRRGRHGAGPDHLRCHRRERGQVPLRSHLPR